MMLGSLTRHLVWSAAPRKRQNRRRDWPFHVDTEMGFWIKEDPVGLGTTKYGIVHKAVIQTGVKKPRYRIVEARLL